MLFYWPYLLADYYAVLEKIAAGVAIFILISSLDDLFIDAWYWIREAYRTLIVKRRYMPLTPEQLREQSEQPLAIMIPAWLEYDVIAPMLENMVTVLDYRQYAIFVGTYVNDAATIAEVERMKRRYKQLVRVEVPHDGPTCKADCLNWIIQAIFLHEEQQDIQFAGVILHDSEDVLHPLELKFFNYLLPRVDLIQLPVTSLERDWYELVAGVYMDEFAEWHAKDLVVRESMTSVVPSAGVGTCFSRRALLALIETSNNQPFNTDSLTEDYDIGIRLARLGMKSIMARFPVQFQVKRNTWFGYGRPKELTLTMPLCVREFFPDTFRASYRQKARWTLGIGLQGWSQIGWRGSLAHKYLLIRDRKGILTSLVTILAYVLLAQFILFQAAAAAGWWTAQYPSIFANEEWLSTVIWLNVIAYGLRLAQRIYFVTRLFGWVHGVMSVPRLVVGNIVNFMATARAWKIFLSHQIFGSRIVWDKTMHDFPNAEALVRDRQRLGELLVAWQAVDEQTLQSALAEQAQRSVPLGRILVTRGDLDEETLAEAIAFQANLSRIHLNADLVQASSGLVPVDLCVRERLLPIDAGKGKPMLVAAAKPLEAEVLEELRSLLGYVPEQRIAREGEIAAGLRLLRGSSYAFQDNGMPLLGDILLEKGLVDPDALAAALREYRPDQHGRIGDFLVTQGVVTRGAIHEALGVQQRILSLAEA
ncbi:glycosyl transferase family protein [Microvirga rosea]|uniref:glycosyl transferase family protein n=1 Tax=Microvirga rosea TaxID=2715425 RepID=UPI001D09D23B|nr:glycosyl transferase family protein [Microvirga rosea]MCB8822798.1 glycosyl transferase family protein [Microvirga rosea]